MKDAAAKVVHATGTGNRVQYQVIASENDHVFETFLGKAAEVRAYQSAAWWGRVTRIRVKVVATALSRPSTSPRAGSTDSGADPSRPESCAAYAQFSRQTLDSLVRLRNLLMWSRMNGMTSW